MTTKKDLKDLLIVKKLLDKIDNIDADYVNRVSDQLFKKQPFFLTVLLGYRLDTTPFELEEIMKVYFLIWEYFQIGKKIHIQKVKEELFIKVEDRHIAMLRYTDGEPDPVKIRKIYDTDIANLKSKALFVAIHIRFHSRPVLDDMDPYKKGRILIGIKSFIECFENLEA